MPIKPDVTWDAVAGYECTGEHSDAHSDAQVAQIAGSMREFTSAGGNLSAV